jgi:hypothetical protein
LGWLEYTEKGIYGKGVKSCNKTFILAGCPVNPVNSELLFSSNKKAPSKGLEIGMVNFGNIFRSQEIRTGSILFPFRKAPVRGI